MAKLDIRLRQHLTVADTVALAHKLYDGHRGGIKRKQLLRPYICPFHVLVGYIPPGARLLDVGCGAGLFVSLLAELDFVQSAVGFDANKTAIEFGQGVVAEQDKGDRIQFECRDVYKDEWPAGLFDVVSLIDVMHHVQPEEQEALLKTAARHVAPGGILLYKDMARRPLWRAWANRLHDLLSAGDWIHYVAIEEIVGWGRKYDLRVEHMGATNMLWYAHEWCVLRRASEDVKRADSVPAGPG